MALIECRFETGFNMLTFSALFVLPSFISYPILIPSRSLLLYFISVASSRSHAS